MLIKIDLKINHNSLEYVCESQASPGFHIYKCKNINFEEFSKLGIKNVELIQDLNSENYDSSKSTLEHIQKVSNLLSSFSQILLERGKLHDKSKLSKEEKFLFDKYTPILKDLVYNSGEYKESLEKLKPALVHHYENNSHHPEHYANGIDGMNLFDIVEMYCEWIAASQRTLSGSIEKSIEINSERFNMSKQLENIFKNTVNKF